MVFNGIIGLGWGGTAYIVPKPFGYLDSLGLCKKLSPEEHGNFKKFWTILKQRAALIGFL